MEDEVTCVMCNDGFDLTDDGKCAEKTPAGPDTTVVPAPGEPEGPGGPDGPEEVDNTDTESGGSSGETPENANDGDPDTCFTSEKQDHPWWSLDLGKEWEITAIKVAACSDSRE